ncbi:MAG: FAD-dependent oxidoreductase [Helicobacteraceae bacterium]|jgi:thioredoxin reductase (NADPH)|nr:FAD-dependent oxidoreductase [Helicobacteraceae bacterium]
MLDLAIVGGGPAGLTAGLYASRGGLKDVVMFEPGMVGGQITGSSDIENYPSQMQAISGMELMQNWLPQAQKFGLKHETEEIVRVSKSADGNFTLTAASGKRYEFKSVIFCTGSVPNRAGFEGEEEFFGRGISGCATCDGFFNKGKDVAVIGGGNAALEEAVYLAGMCNKVYLIHRRESFRAAPLAVEKTRETKNVEMILNAAPIKVLGDQASGVTGLTIETKNGQRRDLAVSGIFVFVGRSAKTDALRDENGRYLCDLDKNGEVVTDIRMHTSVDGLFAAGDIRAHSPKQVVVAAGDGAVAALEAIAYLERGAV